MEPSIPHGIAPFDLGAPRRNLAAEIRYAPLRDDLSAAGLALRREQEARRQRDAQAAYEAATVDWQATRALLGGNWPALAALGVHEPELDQYRGAVCSECCESDLDDAVPVAWACGTYAAIKGAALAIGAPEAAGGPEPHRVALSVRVKPPGVGGSYTVTHPPACHRLPYGKVCDFDMTWWRSKPELPELGVYDAMARDGAIEFTWVRDLEAGDRHG